MSYLCLIGRGLKYLLSTPLPRPDCTITFYLPIGYTHPGQVLDLLGHDVVFVLNHSFDSFY